MNDFDFAWSPRLLQTGRAVRLPLRTDDSDVDVDPGQAREIDRRWSAADQTLYIYVQAPDVSADVTIRARRGSQEASCVLGVRSLQDLRRRTNHNGAVYPRRWPLAAASTPSTKRAQVLTDLPLGAPAPDLVDYWLRIEDAELWRQLPVAELPRAHFVNCHQGCPSCGTAIFSFSGFYPWVRTHTPADFNSTCPQCGLSFPDNDVLMGDFSGAQSGSASMAGRTVVDDGYGYVDEEGHLFLFTATYCRDQTRAFGAGIGAMAAHVRTEVNDLETARRLALMLLRYAAEEVYLAAVPQFRYGPTLGTELLWEWTTTGQTDWASQVDPVRALYRIGSQRYCIDTPYISETLAIAYDTVWPLLREDEQIADRARACGLDLAGPEDAVELVEEMLRCLLQVHLDGGASSNLPRVSEGVLVLLRALQRGDGQDAMQWLYDEGPDKLRVFTSNNFFPDGTPPEATGGYNNIHTNGVFALEHHLRQLQADQPGAYDDSPSLLADPRAGRIALAPYDISMVGGAFLGFGDGGGPVVQHPLPADAYHTPLATRSLNWAADYTADPAVVELRDAVQARQHLPRDLTILDGVGLAVLRRSAATPGTPEVAAAGIVYGDASGHRHQDLLDVQLWAGGQPFLSDLGYPQSWASIRHWEGHWATHNSVWATIPEISSHLAGRGRIVRSLAVDGAQLVEVEAARWIQAEDGRWHKTDVTFRRLIALLATDGDDVVLVDLARVAGGDEHLRLCRGLEGELQLHGVGTTPRPGTLAGPDHARGETDDLDHFDHAGLAWMDDVAAVDQADGWRGTWQSTRDPAAHLNIHVLRAGDSRAYCARATATMGAPESSTYAYQALCWRRTPVEGTTAFDLVFEPRHGDAQLTDVQRINNSDAAAIGIDLHTKAGRRLRLWWSPEQQEGSSFADGTTLSGALAMDLDGQQWSTAPAMTGQIRGLDRQEGWIDVAGCDHIEPGERLIVNPDGRARNYAVIRRQAIAGGQRLWLDVTSQLGRGRILKCDGDDLHLRYVLFTRTGYLHGARMCAADNDTIARDSGVEIINAWNPDPHHTRIQLRQPLPGVGVGDWVWATDYVLGDSVQWEAVRSTRS